MFIRLGAELVMVSAEGKTAITSRNDNRPAQGRFRDNVSAWIVRHLTQMSTYSMSAAHLAVRRVRVRWSSIDIRDLAASTLID
jgi:hypothetical protein